MEHRYITEWFKYADMDYITAEHLRTLHPQPLEIICFHCQQTAEKLLKGYLIYSGVTEPPKTHNLDTLCLLCAEYDDRFHEIKKASGVLTQYGIQPRYPNEMEIAEKDMQKALEYTKQIRDFEPLVKIRTEIGMGQSPIKG
ncbi:MAG: HEPN domain-containing protein [Oscillospiraceae bacterium]|nr:HEPN domain-containing protein [Oscillospiraceae bacterium]